MAATEKEEKKELEKTDTAAKEKKKTNSSLTNKCGKCKKKLANKPTIDDEQSIECDCCLLFFHIVCVNVSVQKLDAVAEHKLKWYCMNCEPAAMKLKQICTSLQAQQSFMKKEIEGLKQKLAEQDNKINNTESKLQTNLDSKFTDLEFQITELSAKFENQSNSNKVAELETKVATLSSKLAEEPSENETVKNLQSQVNELKSKLADHPTQLNDSDTASKSPTQQNETSLREIIAEELQEKQKLDEEKLKEKKKMNLMFFNFKEDQHKTNEDLMLDDFNKIQSAYEGRVTIIESDITHITRIGKKQNDKVRPILVTFKSEEKRMEILRRGKNLEDKSDEGELTKVYVAPDKTKKQREHEKLLRDQIKERTSNGEKNLVIRNDKIVPFRPAAQKSWASLFA